MSTTAQMRTRVAVLVFAAALITIVALLAAQSLADPLQALASGSRGSNIIW